jgi:hypothetical protein
MASPARPRVEAAYLRTIRRRASLQANKRTDANNVRWRSEMFVRTEMPSPLKGGLLFAIFVRLNDPRQRIPFADLFCGYQRLMRTLESDLAGARLR